MKLFLFLFLLMPISAFAGDTFTTKDYHRPFTLGLDAKAYKAHRAARRALPRAFRQLEAAYLGALDLRTVAQLSPIYDQGGCGSCVYNGCSSTIMDDYILAGAPLPGVLARQFQMDCGAPWSCSGSYASAFFEHFQKLGGSPLESVYPYHARDQRCGAAGGPLYGLLKGYREIANTQQSMIAALNARHTLAVTVAAGAGQYMNYSGGVYNRCSRGNTDHQVQIVGYDCETAKNPDGSCKFDASGKLPPGVGYWIQRNSWGTGWGEKGFIRIKMTDSSGHLCNEIAEEVYVVDVAAAPPPKPAPSCTLKAAKSTVKVNEPADVTVTAKDTRTATYGGTVISLLDSVGKFTVTYGTPGFQTVQVAVTGEGGTAACETQLTVLPSDPPSPASHTTIAILIGVAILVVGGIVAAVVLR